MISQLDKVLDGVRKGKVTAQIIPFAAGAYVAADGYFVLLEFEEDADLWPIVFIEGLSSNQYLEPLESVELMTRARELYVGG